MEAFLDPNVLVGLLALIGLEIILGVDNLIFIAILTEGLPPAQRDRARLIGLSLALLMRLVLLAGMSFLVGLTADVLHLGPLHLSWRDLILIGGGCFLLFKATTEIHERLEGVAQSKKRTATTSFFAVIAQIIVLDAVFSLDSIITAVGIVRDLWVMITAVTIAMVVMIVGSGPLTRFVNKHPTIIMLCLAFLLMIGLSLLMEGLGAEIPKGYLYAAMAFSILVEAFNQIRTRNLRKHAARLPLRERTTNAVLRMLGGQRLSAEDTDGGSGDEGDPLPFGDMERDMVAGVLRLRGRTVRSVMTPRQDIAWIDITAGAADIRAAFSRHGHARYLVCENRLEELRGVLLVKDVLENLIDNAPISLPKCIHSPVVIPESLPLTSLVDTLKTTPTRLAIVSDDFGDIQGLVTPTDILAEIAPDLVEEEDTIARPISLDTGALRFRGATPIDEVALRLDRWKMVPGRGQGGKYATLAGFMLWHMGSVPREGQTFDWQGFRFTASALRGHRIETVDIEPLPGDTQGA